MFHGGAPHKISFLSGTKVCEKLAEILENKIILKDIRMISPHIQTSSLEAFHSLVIRYAPKHTGFSFLAMCARYAIFQKFLVFEVLNAPVCLYNLHTARMIECAILVYVSGSFWQDFITMKIATECKQPPEMATHASRSGSQSTKRETTQFGKRKQQQHMVKLITNLIFEIIIVIIIIIINIIYAGSLHL